MLQGKGKIKSNYRVREKNSFLKNKALEVGLETNMEKLMSSGSSYGMNTSDLNEYKKELNDPDNHESVISYQDPDILDCEVKWALGSITTDKVSRVMEFKLSYFKS